MPAKTASVARVTAASIQVSRVMLPIPNPFLPVPQILLGELQQRAQFALRRDQYPQQFGEHRGLVCHCPP